MKLKIKFYGKARGAIGINYQIDEIIEVEDTKQETLFQALYERGYEMMHWLDLKDITNDPEPDKQHPITIKGTLKEIVEKAQFGEDALREVLEAKLLCIEELAATALEEIQ